MTRARALLAALALGAGTAVAAAHAAEPALPAGAAERIDEVFAEWRGADRPGCAVGVVRDGELALARGYGMANLEHGVPIDARSVFDIGSVSKQFTAAAIALLALDGRLALDDDVRRFVPELPAGAAPVTIRHLLHHRGGLREYTWTMALAGADDADLTSTAEALAMIVRQRGTDFAPGERYGYSNTGYFLLGLVVERAAGESLARFAERRLFAPLGMAATHFRDDHARIVPHRAQGYARREGGGFAVAMSDWEQVGDGSLLTSVEDLARWVRNLETGEVGGPRFVELMASAGEATGDEGGGSYGLARFVGTWRGRRALRHGGSWAGYRAHLLHVPEERLAVAILCNVAQASGLGGRAEAVAAIALGEPLERAASAAAAAAAPSASTEPADPLPAPVPLSAARLAALAGRYWSEELWSVWELAIDDGGLVLRRGDGTARALTPAPGSAADALEMVGGEDLRLRFSAADDGPAGGFDLVLGPGPPHRIAFRRLETAPPPPRANPD